MVKQFFLKNRTNTALKHLFLAQARAMVIYSYDTVILATGEVGKMRHVQDPMGAAIVPRVLICQNPTTVGTAS